MANLRRPIVLLVMLLLVAPAFAQDANKAPSPDDQYQLGPDSLERGPGVSKGTVTQHVFKDSKVFPGTIREYWVYVPAQYDGKTPAAVMVYQDGGSYVREENGNFRTPIVMDNLIHRGEIPVTIGIFINPGHKSGELPTKGQRSSNRSFEYDTLSADYATFLIDEILPEVGKKYRLTDDPSMRGICGSSSGGICAWTVAWERPDQFRKVISFIGSFTNIRGGHNYHAMIRKTEPKPIRIFQQDGSNDLDNPHGNWWLSNLELAAALEYAKYDHKFVAGEGGHNSKHAGMILPDALRWLWRDWKSTE